MKIVDELEKRTVSNAGLPMTNMSDAVRPTDVPVSLFSIISICAHRHVATPTASQIIITSSCCTLYWFFGGANHRNRAFFSSRKRESMLSPALVCLFVCLSVCVSVCLFVTTITKKIVDGFVPNFMGKFLGEKEDQVRVSL